MATRKEENLNAANTALAAVGASGLGTFLKAQEALATATGVVRPTVLSAGSTLPALATTECTFQITGVPTNKAAVAAGTALTATTHDVAIDKWASYTVSIVLAGTITITKSADVDTEALALAAKPAAPSALEAVLGHMTIRGGTSAIFDATTDDLVTGDVVGGIVNFFPAATVVPAFE